MLNLLSNAAKFCDRPDGRITVGLAQQRNYLRVDVTDNGDGIPLTDQERIFERFQQGPRAGDGGDRGTGLGLPISREIIRHFGGRFWVQSTPRHGATFSFTVPMQAIRAGRKADV
jgi:signal transduction histidine kinase